MLYIKPLKTTKLSYITKIYLSYSSGNLISRFSRKVFLKGTGFLAFQTGSLRNGATDFNFKPPYFAMIMTQNLKHVDMFVSDKAKLRRELRTTHLLKRNLLAWTQCILGPRGYPSLDGFQIRLQRVHFILVRLL